jgi:hypothetical protein
MIRTSCVTDAHGALLMCVLIYNVVFIYLSYMYLGVHGDNRHRDMHR